VVDPIVLRLLEKLEEEVWAINQEVIQPIPSGLEDGNRDIGVLSQSSGKDESCCSTTTDDIVVLFASKVLDRHGACESDVQSLKLTEICWTECKKRSCGKACTICNGRPQPLTHNWEADCRMVVAPALALCGVG
jgi:hypothetical protein